MGPGTDLPKRAHRHHPRGRPPLAILRARQSCRGPCAATARMSFRGRRRIPATPEEGEMDDQDIRAALDWHWAASQAGDDDAEDEIYHDDAVLEYPQSGERIRGRRAIRTTRGLLPNKQFTIRR